MKTINLGIIGCGMISDAYFKAAQRFEVLSVAACADQMTERAEEKTETYGVPNMSAEDLLHDTSVDIVLNLTPPKVHVDVMAAALEAGKHVYTEKPLAIDLDAGKRILALAREKNLRVGCAPDTFLGGGQQTARKMLDDGWIGRPIAGTATVMGRGPEKWPQAPFFYDHGAGPMLDLGPYYITSLVNLLGPAESVVAVTGKGGDTRTGGPETVPRVYPVNVPTHLTGVVTFRGGAIITITASFEVYKHTHPPIEIYGDQGTLQIPDPNTFRGPVRIFRPGYEEWRDAPLSHGYTDNSRSIGAADMACSLNGRRPHRANGDLALHVLEIMLAFDGSMQTGRKIDLTTSCERPTPLPLGLVDGQLDA